MQVAIQWSSKSKIGVEIFVLLLKSGYWETMRVNIGDYGAASESKSGVKGDPQENSPTRSIKSFLTAGTPISSRIPESTDELLYNRDHSAADRRRRSMPAHPRAATTCFVSAKQARVAGGEGGGGRQILDRGARARSCVRGPWPVITATSTATSNNTHAPYSTAARETDHERLGAWFVQCPKHTHQHSRVSVERRPWALAFDDAERRVRITLQSRSRLVLLPTRYVIFLVSPRLQEGKGGEGRGYLAVAYRKQARGISDSGQGDQRLQARQETGIKIWAALNSVVLRADEGVEVSVERRRNEGAGGNGIFPRRPADPRHRPARFPNAKLRCNPAGDRARIALVGGEQANLSVTAASRAARQYHLTKHDKLETAVAEGYVGASTSFRGVSKFPEVSYTKQRTVERNEHTEAVFPYLRNAKYAQRSSSDRFSQAHLRTSYVTLLPANFTHKLHEASGTNASCADITICQERVDLEVSIGGDQGARMLVASVQGTELGRRQFHSRGSHASSCAIRGRIYRCTPCRRAAWLKDYCTSEAYKSGSARSDRDMCINSPIASTRKALNWRAVLLSITAETTQDKISGKEGESLQFRPLHAERGSYRRQSSSLAPTFPTEFYCALCVPPPSPYNQPPFATRIPPPALNTTPKYYVHHFPSPPTHQGLHAASTHITRLTIQRLLSPAKHSTSQCGPPTSYFPSVAPGTDNKSTAIPHDETGVASVRRETVTWPWKPALLASTCLSENTRTGSSITSPVTMRTSCEDEGRL
ncbi:hypothetical protein PR048_006544 [Dryococelus australis]|uniref:Uncharacterized protein n=1 Tax=Dryococelus australis TaxID=614101 RepID=A0ABQ9IB95_9NEOP|nr:hypothetical protein PR048_006544 [Dryococelus australis]